MALLGLCNDSSSNSSHYFIFKEDLQKLHGMNSALEIRIAHYPPYCSKYNPIEHRLFPHVTTPAGRDLYQCGPEIEDRTSKGLQVVVDIIDGVFQTGRKVAADFKATMRIVFDAVLPQWNYRAVPNQTVI